MKNVATDVANFWDGYVPVANVVGGFATGIATGFALAALFVGLRQISKSLAISRELDAQQTYNEYLKLCVEYPELSSSVIAKSHLNIQKFETILTKPTTKSEQYLWFVSFMLNASEKILLSVDVDGPWKSAIAAQIGYHEELLEDVWPIWRQHYSHEMRSIMASTLRLEDKDVGNA